jgi:multiple sugar transport system ATP-binding protein
VNLFAASLSADGGAAEAAGARFVLGAAQRAAVTGRAGQPVRMGLRPEDLVPGGSPEGIRARVELVEPLGNETLVHWSSALGPLVSRITSGPVPAAGTGGTLEARADAVLLFDTATGEALLRGEPASAAP